MINSTAFDYVNVLTKAADASYQNPFPKYSISVRARS